MRTKIVTDKILAIDGQNPSYEEKVKAWLFDLYKNSDDPMVDMNNLFVGIEDEELIIDEIILNESPFRV